MTDFLKRTWSEIDLDVLANNLKEIEQILAPGARVMAVVKADGYGHGDALTAKALAEQGVSWFGVSNIEEAISIRRTVPGGDVLIFGLTPPELAATIVDYQLTQTVYSLSFAKLLSAEAAKTGVVVNCHLKLDTGMSRLGLAATKTGGCLREARQIYQLPGLHFTGIFTHFASADENDPSGRAFTREQFDRFLEACLALEAEGFHLGLRHCCNSAATLLYPEMHLDLVRPGIALYGILPSPETRTTADLKPVMTVKAAVAMVKLIPPGAVVSYGRAFTAQRETLVATLPVGYADGYHRLISGKGYMLLHGKQVPIIGRICMDQLMLDVTDVGCAVGDEVTLFGQSQGEGLSAVDLAGWAQTIPYEIICSLGKRVSRVYFQEGKQVAVTRYKYIKY